MATVRELMASDTELAYLAMRELRGEGARVRSRDAFVAWVNGEQRPEGYRLVGVFAQDDAEAVGAAGFRRLHSLAWGDYLYVDDLITREAFRAHGFGADLMRWLREQAAHLGCEGVHLDSGVQRFAAHRLYHRFGMKISAHHFEVATLAAIE